MERPVFVVFFFIFVNSCNPSFKERVFKSENNGYYLFELSLMSDGKLKMTLMATKAMSSNSTGDSWSEITRCFEGSWSMKHDNLCCVFNERKSKIYEVFDNSDFVEFKNMNC